MGLSIRSQPARLQRILTTFCGILVHALLHTFSHRFQCVVIVFRPQVSSRNQCNIAAISSPAAYNKKQKRIKYHSFWMRKALITSPAYKHRSALPYAESWQRTGLAVSDDAVLPARAWPERAVSYAQSVRVSSCMPLRKQYISGCSTALRYLAANVGRCVHAIKRLCALCDYRL